MFSHAKIALLLSLLLIITLHNYSAETYAANTTVVISEFMASNGDTLNDLDGDSSDWIELHNRGAAPVDLSGFYLTDDAEELDQWQLPALTLGAGKTTVIFASGKELTGSELHTNFKLKSGGEYLALVEPDGETVVFDYAPEYPQQYRDVSYGVNAAGTARYYTQPSPNVPQGNQSSDLAPILIEPAHEPSQPAAGQAVNVSVLLLPGQAAAGEVHLHYRVMFGAERTLVMVPDGDGRYAATIPGSVAQPGEIIRWYFSTTDAANRTARWPLFVNVEDSAEYLGTMVRQPVTTDLPRLNWFAADLIAAESRVGTRGVVVYNGMLYDNVLIRRRGQTSHVFPKKNLKFDFNTGSWFELEGLDPVEEFNLNSTYTDKAFLRTTLAWETMRDAGVPYSHSVPMHVRYNGNFFSLAVFVEQPDERYMERQQMDPEGALYKVYSDLETPDARVEKKTRQHEDDSDLRTFITGVTTLNGTARRNFLFDNLNVAEVVNYLAAMALTNNNDHVAKNYYLYRDSDDSQEWQILPWDFDLTFGRIPLDNGSIEANVLHDEIFANHPQFSHPLFGSAAYPNPFDRHNYLIDAILTTPELRNMYLRRLRTLMDDLLQAPGTPYSELYFETRGDELFGVIATDAARDRAVWPTWGASQTVAESVDILKDDYFAVRRSYLYGHALVPAAQAANQPIEISEIYLGNSDTAGDQFITLRNPGASYVDMSDWIISGAITHTITPGTVLPPGATLILANDVAPLHSQKTGIYAQGDLPELPHVAGTLTLTSAAGDVIAQSGYRNSSPLYAQLVISELNYHPPEDDAMVFDDNDFEFIELANVGNEAIDLAGVQFTDGVEFVFDSADSIPANGFIVLVKNIDAFAQRYPDVTPFGSYDGKLSNSGETITLVDASGGLIDEVDYLDEAPWPTEPDGDGATLVRDNLMLAGPISCMWRASSEVLGSPGLSDMDSNWSSCIPIYLPVATKNG